MDDVGRAWSKSRSHADGFCFSAQSPLCRVGLDLEALRPTESLLRASELLLPSERAWAEELPSALHWRRHLALWVAKEAVLKALGQGFAFGLDQVELGLDSSGALVLRRLGGSEALARGWHLSVQEMTLEGRPYLVALATV